MSSSSSLDQNPWTAAPSTLVDAARTDGDGTLPAAPSSSRIARAPSLFLVFPPAEPDLATGLPSGPGAATDALAVPNLRSSAESSPYPTLAQQAVGRLSLADMSLHTIKPSMLRQLAGPPLSPSAEVPGLPGGADGAGAGGRAGERAASSAWTEGGSYFTAVGTIRGTAPEADEEDGEVVLELWSPARVATGHESPASPSRAAAVDSLATRAAVRMLAGYHDPGEPDDDEPSPPLAHMASAPASPRTIHVHHPWPAGPPSPPDPADAPTAAEPGPTLRDHAERAFWAIVMPSISELVAWKELVQSGVQQPSGQYSDDTVYTLRFPILEGGELGPTVRPVLVRKRTGLPAFESGYDELQGVMGRLGSRR